LHADKDEAAKFASLQDPNQPVFKNLLRKNAGAAAGDHKNIVSGTIIVEEVIQ